jgi:gas vesicle protein
MSRDDRSRKTGHGRELALLLAGIGIGSIIALLSAPSSGEKLRHTLGREYRKATRKIGRHTDDLRDRADEMLERSQDLRELGSKLLHFGRRHKSA